MYIFLRICSELEHALSCLAREDPSLRISSNDSGQTVLSGMGELHLEIIHDRLKRDYGVDCSLGKLQVSYKECPTKEVTQEGIILSPFYSPSPTTCYFDCLVSLDRTIGSKRHTVSATIRVCPKADTFTACSSASLRPEVSFRHDVQQTLRSYSMEELAAAVTEGVEGACIQGMSSEQ